jgi:ribose 5-phosphate isomerase
MSQRIVDTIKTRDRIKLKAAEHAVELVQPGMTVGLGSGSTSVMWIRLHGERVRNHGLQITAVASSENSEQLGQSYGIPSYASISVGELIYRSTGQARLVQGWF